MSYSEYVIRLRGLRFFGYHGVLPEEGRRGQFFLVDLVLTCCPIPHDDDIAAAVDYSAVYETVKRIVTGEPLQLIESVVLRIGRAVLAEFPRVSRARVTVRKPEAPLPGPFEGVAVEKVFDRGWSRPFLLRSESPLVKDGAGAGADAGGAGADAVTDAVTGADAVGVAADAVIDAGGAGAEVGAAAPGETVYLGLGSNLGDRLAMLRCALATLRERGVKIISASPVYETEPWGVAEQPPFLNAVVKARTDLSPVALLRACKEAEASCGRIPSRRWGPRAIDVDILLYGEQEIRESEPNLHIPHRHLTDRAFVLIPLADIASGITLPDGRPIEPLAAGIDAGGMRLAAPAGWAAEFLQDVAERADEQ